MKTTTPFLKKKAHSLDLILCLGGLAGAVLNSFMSIWGLVVWLPVNIGFIILNLRRGYYEQAALFSGYALTSILGLIWWR